MPRAAAALLIALFAYACLCTAAAAAAELEKATSLAFARYFEDIERAFLARSREHSERLPRDGETHVRPAREDGIITVEGGLVHHWAGTTFIGNATLADALAVSYAYDAYQTIYRPVIASRLLERNGDTYRVRLRIKEGAAGISAVLDIHSQVRYLFPDSATVLSISTADEIREVKDPGTAAERLLPAGQDSGYLWRAVTLNRLRQRENGVVIEMETIGLSRRFPRMMGWFIEPIARRLGRKSIETSLQEFRTAVRARRPR